MAWASLPEDLVLQLGWRVLAGDFLGYVRFRAVCSNWRSVTVSPRGRGVVDQRFHPRRWTMLPEGHGLYPGHGKLRGWVRFFNLDTGTFVRVRLHLFKEHCALDSVNGLLVLQRDNDTAIRLFHPFTGDIADLPPLATLHPQVNPLLIGGLDEKHRWMYLRSVHATSCTVSAAGVITVMLALNSMERIAFATTQDQQWTLSSWKIPDCSKHLSFKGKLYVVSNNSFVAGPQILEIDPPLQEGILLPPKLIATCQIDKYCMPIYLVESNSEVLVVRYTSDSGSPIAVFKLSDIVLGRFIPLKSIGDNAIFLHSTTLSVSAKVLPTLVRNTLIHNHTSGYVAQYHLSSETLSPALDDCDLNGFAQSPYSLVRLIFTCCFPRLWNKGLIHCPDSYSHLFDWKAKGKFRNGA